MKIDALHFLRTSGASIFDESKISKKTGQVLEAHCPAQAVANGHFKDLVPDTQLQTEPSNLSLPKSAREPRIEQKQLLSTFFQAQMASIQVP